MVATLAPATSITTTMHPAVSEPSDWSPERLDRLARGMFAVVVGMPVPSFPDVLADNGDESAVEEHP